VTWFQSIDFVAVVALAPSSCGSGAPEKRGTEPDDLAKITIGCAIFALSCAWLSLSEVLAGPRPVALLWHSRFMSSARSLICTRARSCWGSYHALRRIGERHDGGILLSVVFVGGIGSGWLGRFYEKLTPRHSGCCTRRLLPAVRPAAGFSAPLEKGPGPYFSPICAQSPGLITSRRRARSAIQGISAGYGEVMLDKVAARSALQADSVHRRGRLPGEQLVWATVIRSPANELNDIVRRTPGVGSRSASHA